jgi:hypothetical protein
MGWGWNWPINDFTLAEDRIMQIRNPIYTATGNIDCEVEHPQFGWIPFTASPDDVEPHGQEVYTEALAMGPILAAPIPGEAVNAERDRRILQGKTFALSTGKQISLRGDNTTKKNLQALAFAASMRVSQDQGAVITLFRDNTDYVYELTQLEIIELWSRSAEFVSKMFQAGWFIKDAPSIPKDYADDKYWKDA